ncbi:MAG TPA: carboxypeptidase-like regulatory domain-containing protein [Candidatus Eisenbacteria bacterium]|jgi:Carboxypeptidase regulatory-like domain|nr:carboxypeptidase-like regulatory domain-containing protein [Candidatus Eisenbacteria bacterium]
MITRLRLIGLGVVMLLIASMGLAQDNKKESQLRSVHGVTMDKGESPIASAVVFLKNTRSNAIRSYISDDQGNYRFSGLDPNTDYEVHAEKDGAQSQTRTISSFDSKKEIVVNLKLDKKKT